MWQDGVGGTTGSFEGLRDKEENRMGKTPARQSALTIRQRAYANAVTILLRNDLKSVAGGVLQWLLKHWGAES